MVDNLNDWVIVLAAFLGSGGSAWASVRVSLGFLKEGIADAKEDAKEAHQHAQKAHDRIDFLYKPTEVK